MGMQCRWEASISRRQAWLSRYWDTTFLWLCL